MYAFQILIRLFYHLNWQDAVGAVLNRSTPLNVTGIGSSFDGGKK
jgi:hypothetical protein